MELNMFISLYGAQETSCFEIVVFRKVSVMFKSCLTNAKFCDKLTKLEWKLDKLLYSQSAI